MNDNKNIPTSQRPAGAGDLTQMKRTLIFFLDVLVISTYLMLQPERLVKMNEEIEIFRKISFPGRGIFSDNRFPLSPRGKLGEAGGAGADPPSPRPHPLPGRGRGTGSRVTKRPLDPPSLMQMNPPALINSANDQMACRGSGGGIRGEEAGR